MCMPILLVRCNVRVDNMLQNEYGDRNRKARVPVLVDSARNDMAFDRNRPQHDCPDHQCHQHGTSYGLQQYEDRSKNNRQQRTAAQHRRQSLRQTRSLTETDDDGGITGYANESAEYLQN